MDKNGSGIDNKTEYWISETLANRINEVYLKLRRWRADLTLNVLYKSVRELENAFIDAIKYILSTEDVYLFKKKVELGKKTTFEPVETRRIRDDLMDILRQNFGDSFVLDSESVDGIFKSPVYLLQIIWVKNMLVKALCPYSLQNFSEMVRKPQYRKYLEDVISKEELSLENLRNFLKEMKNWKLIKKLELRRYSKVKVEWKALISFFQGKFLLFPLQFDTLLKRIWINNDNGKWYVELNDESGWVKKYEWYRLLYEYIESWIIEGIIDSKNIKSSIRDFVFCEENKNYEDAVRMDINVINQAIIDVKYDLSAYELLWKLIFSEWSLVTKSFY